MERTKINNLQENQSAKIEGFVERVRDTRYMVFVILKDISGKIQISIDKEKDAALVDSAVKLVPGSVISVCGKLSLNPAVKQGGKEFLPASLDVLSLAEPSPIDGETNIENRMNFRWIDLRTDKNQLMCKVESEFTSAFKDFLVKNDFIEIHTPKLIGAESESGAGVFEVKYYDTKAFLTQSPQFYKQMAMAAGLERVFEFGPVFRAEKFSTNRHASEYTSLDLEMSYINSYEDVMNFEEDLIIYILTQIKAKYGEEIKNVFDTDIVVPTKPFPRMELADLYKIFESKYNYKVAEEEKTDLTTEGERLACRYAKEHFGHEFIFVVGFPGDKRPFYHMRDDAGRLMGYDLLWKGIEITSGAQREHRYEQLKAVAESKGLKKDVEFYLEFFKYGCPPHGGFAIGMERFLMLLLNIDTIKEVQFLFRGPNRLAP